MTSLAQETDTEIWKPVACNHKYVVSNLGNIKSIDRELTVSDPKYNRVYKTFRKEKLIVPSSNQRGYLRIDLRSTDRKSGHTAAVHRLVAQAFIPNPNNHPQVNHKNGIKTDNRVENLEWCTNIENRRHAQRIGLYGDMKGQNSPARKLDQIQVLTIRKCIADGMKYKELATYFKVGRGCIKDINLNRTWSSLR